jgi:hypothetical protein
LPQTFDKAVRARERKMLGPIWKICNLHLKKIHKIGLKNEKGYGTIFFANITSVYVHQPLQIKKIHESGTKSNSTLQNTNGWTCFSNALVWNTHTRFACSTRTESHKQLIPLLN